MKAPLIHTLDEVLTSEYCGRLPCLEKRKASRIRSISKRPPLRQLRPCRRPHLWLRNLRWHRGLGVVRSRWKRRKKRGAHRSGYLGSFRASQWRPELWDVRINNTKTLDAKNEGIGGRTAFGFGDGKLRPLRVKAHVDKEIVVGLCHDDSCGKCGRVFRGSWNVAQSVFVPMMMMVMVVVNVG